MTAGCTAAASPADLPGLLSRLAELRREHGTDGKPFEVHVISVDAYSLDGIRRLEDEGVTDVIVGFRWPYHIGPDTEDAAAQGGQPAPLRRRRHRQGRLTDSRRSLASWTRPP